MRSKPAKMLAAMLTVTLLLGGLAMAESTGDAKMDAIQALEPQNYEGIFAQLATCDGAYADALGRKLLESFTLDPDAFLTALLPYQEAEQTSLFQLLAYTVTQDYACGTPDGMTALYEAGAKLAETPFEKADPLLLLGRLQEQVQLSLRDMGLSDSFNP